MTVREEVQQRIEQDPELIRIRKKIESGKATYADTAAYSNRAGKLLGEVFSRRLPDIPPEEREPLCVELLHDRYIDINAAIDTAQRYMDDALGIHIAPQHAPFDSERGHQIGSSLRDLSKPVETLQRRAKAAPETATKAMHDDRMKAESKFRHRAGLDCRITRVAVNGCCPWCSKVAGRYRYGEEPDDIYRRHDNCDCTVTFENGRKRQDVWSKREWEVPGKDAGAGEPVVLTAEQARNAGTEQPIRFSKAEKMAAVGADVIKADRIEHSAEEKLSLAQFARSLGIEYKNAMSFDGDSDLLKEQLSIMASLRDEFKLPKRIVFYVKDLGKDLGETYYRKTIMINSVALRSDMATNAYLNSDNQLSSSKTIGIGVHEIGHLIAQQYGEIGLDIAQKACYNISGKNLSYSQVLDYLEDNISIYSTKKYYKVTSKHFKPTHFHEVIPEVLGKHFTSPDEFTTEFFKLLKEVCGV